MRLVAPVLWEGARNTLEGWDQEVNYTAISVKGICAKIIRGPTLVARRLPRERVSV